MTKKPYISLREIDNDPSHLLYLSNVKYTKDVHDGREPDTYFLVRIENLQERIDSDEKYYATICACGPGWPNDDTLLRVCESYGKKSLEYFRNAPLSQQLAMLIADGIHAPIWGMTGNSLRGIKKKARTELLLISSIGGFYLDRAYNMIGNTGWDFMKGLTGNPKFGEEKT